MSLANFLRNNGGHKQLDFEGVERVDCKILECDRLILNGATYTNDSLEGIANLDGLTSTELEIVLTKDLNATNVKLISNNIVGTLITGSQPEIHTLANVASVGTTNTTTTIQGSLEVKQNITTPTFSVDGITGYTTINGNVSCGTITSPTITTLQQQVNYLTTKINKLLEYILIIETDPTNPIVRLKQNVPLEISGAFTQGI